MADTKLSALTELAATPAVDDEVYIRDVSEAAAAESKRITVANLLAGAEVGGLYGINVETLAGDKTLTPGTDEIYQYLAPNGSFRFISLDAGSATAGDRFVIRNTDAYNSTKQLAVKIAGTNEDEIWARDVREYIFNGTTWVAATTGVGEAGTGDSNVGIGKDTSAYNRGVAIGAAAAGRTQGVGVGYVAQGSTYGAAIGSTATGTDYGIGVGYSADGASFGIAIGWDTNTNNKRYSIALGYYSETERVGETSINIDAQSDQENNVVQGRWALQTNNDTPVEIFCAGYSTSRFTIRASSVLAFTLLVTARDNVADEVARYSVSDGLIKRDGAGNTTMVLCTVVTDYEDDALWNIAVTADDVNEALIITVTGDAANPTQWVAVMDGVETHF